MHKVCNVTANTVGVLVLHTILYKYSAIIGQGKCWQKVHFEGTVGKYFANLNLNRIIYVYIINVVLEAL